jgi:hypothetical protein
LSFTAIAGAAVIVGSCAGIAEVAVGENAVRAGVEIQRTTFFGELAFKHGGTNEIKLTVLGNPVQITPNVSFELQNGAILRIAKGWDGLSGAVRVNVTGDHGTVIVDGNSLPVAISIQGDGITIQFDPGGGIPTGLSGGQIAGIVVGSVAFVAICVLLTLWNRRKPCRKRLDYDSIPDAVERKTTSMLKENANELL